MSKQKLRYLGTGPGQGDGVSIGGIKYERNKTYDVDGKLAADLLRRGGFEVVEAPRKRTERKVEEETKSWPKR